MPVTIRLSRHGAKKRPFYRVVVADSRSPRDGRYVEWIGTYDPINGGSLEVKQEKLDRWLARGARPSDTVRTLLKKRKQPEPVVEA